VFGSCGFLSFSSVFVSSVVGLKLRFTFISFGIWVESTRYSSACREGEDEKKLERRAVLRSWRFCRAGVSLLRGGGRVWLGMSLL